jgi:DNA-directed RNA polymerase beta subunit
VRKKNKRNCGSRRQLRHLAAKLQHSTFGFAGVTTHQELSKLTFLSNLAQLIPMPDCNQSPRNMYQCQMGKQTMGTPCLNWRLQSQTKLYRLQTPASPLFRPVHYDNIDLDDFAMGTNAIVAVISYTGYDMEDAMIINKASEERGFAHGSIYKSEFIVLEPATSYFCRDPEKPELAEFIDTDGLPFVGRHMRDGEPFYCYYSVDEFHYIVKKFRGKEECYVDAVKLCASFEASNKTACITFRVPVSTVRTGAIGANRFVSVTRRWEISSPAEPVKKASARSSTPWKIYPSRRLVWCRTSYSTLTDFPPV